MEFNPKGVVIGMAMPPDLTVPTYEQLRATVARLEGELASKQAEADGLRQPWTAVASFMTDSNAPFTSEEIDRIGTLLMEHLLSDKEHASRTALFISRLVSTVEKRGAELAATRADLETALNEMGKDDKELAYLNEQLAALRGKVGDKIAAAYETGYSNGHNDTVEGCYSPEESLGDYMSDVASHD